MIYFEISAVERVDIEKMRSGFQFDNVKDEKIHGFLKRLTAAMGFQVDEITER